MTGQQKHDILAMRSQGLTFAQIARETGLSVNTVKSFSRRASEQRHCASKASESKESKKKEQGKVCVHCGKPVHDQPRTKPKRFCSGECRVQWWNARRGKEQRESMLTNACVCCGAVFASYPSAHRKYCSHGCYVAARFRKEGAYDSRAVRA